MEHYCTLFNHAFLPQGLALHESMVRCCGDFQLYVLCIDPLVEAQLRMLNLPRVTLLPLADFENDELLAVKPERSLAEYCWTLTPQVFGFVHHQYPHIVRLTYLDADLFFFDDPTSFFDEFEASGKDVLITEHAYAPEYDQTATSGQFCVQFLTTNFTPQGLRVIDWWKQRCIEWCFDRIEDGRFGDQKYLDHWPALFPDAVHVLSQKERTVAPWNVNHIAATGGALDPVFFHFHGYRIVHPSWARCFEHYRIDRRHQWIYAAYAKVLRSQLEVLRDASIHIPCRPVPAPRFAYLRYLKWVVWNQTTRWEYLGRELTSATPR